jgi:hypothetical protein
VVRPAGTVAAQARTSAAGATEPKGGGAPEALNAPLFHSLVDRLADGGRFVVLDLGAARTETVRLLGQYRCRLDIAELRDAVDTLNAEESPRRLRELAEAALPARRRESTDLILCWDLINYLKRPALTAVMEAIAIRSRPGSLAHALVYYSARRMPQGPSCFVPLDEQRIANVGPPQPERDAPRYSPEDLAICMPRYAVDRARLLKNGMQEFLFRL